MSVADAENFGVTNGQIVKVKTNGERSLIFDEVVIRVSDKFALDMHIDVEEGNAAGLKQGDRGELIVDQTLFYYFDTMKKIIRIIAIALIIAAGIAIVILGGLDPKDSCLDQGGSYDHQTGMCNK